MKPIAFLLALFLIALHLPASADDERILRYHSDVAVERDGTVTIREQITVQSQQRSIRRGIYRDFPTRYRDRLGNRVVVDFEVLEVRRDGQPEPWFTEQRSNGIRVNTGDDNLLPGPGTYTFTIIYQTGRQIGFFDDHDEFYWNVTGLGWAFPIDQASARVTLPEAVSPSDLRLHHFTGPQGSSISHASAEAEQAGVARFQTGASLAPHEGLTISVGFPKGIIHEPGRAERFGWFLRDNRGMLVMLFGGLGVLLFYLREWLNKGRGPQAGVIIARYEPPEGYSPAGLRYVWRKSYDQRCFTADLVELGVRGRLQIERDKARFSETWRLEQTGEFNLDDLPPSQQALLPKLFEGGSTLELKSANASRIQAAMSAHGAALPKRYKGRYINPNYPTLIVGWSASIALGILAFLVARDVSLALVLSAVALGLLNLIFTGLMPAPTAEGRRLLDHVEGLRLYLRIAEQQDLARLELPDEQPPDMTPERFEALLPYAIALAVEEAWTDKFSAAVGTSLAQETERNMGWYRGSGAQLAGLGQVSQSLGSSLSTTISSSSSPPGSSSGAGGFSGGGGGGGGGGGR